MIKLEEQRPTVESPKVDFIKMHDLAKNLSPFRDDGIGVADTLGHARRHQQQKIDVQITVGVQEVFASPKGWRELLESTCLRSKALENRLQNLMSLVHTHNRVRRLIMSRPSMTVASLDKTPSR